LKGKFYSIISAGFKKLLNIGIKASLPKVEANRIRISNIVALVPLVLYAFSSIYSLVFDFPRIVFINTVALIIIIIALWHNYKEKYSFAKFLILSAHSATILVYYKLMEDETSMFFYFFPVILSFIVFYNPQKEKKLLAATAAFVLSCIILTLVLPNSLFQPFPLSKALHTFINVFNSVCCVLLSGVYVYNIFAVNIRNERLLMKAKEAAEAGSKAKAAFLSNMSHELRTPLNGIIGTTHLMQSEPYLPEQGHQFVVLKNLSEHMLSLVNDILDFSKIESGKFELHPHRFNINQLVKKLDITFHHLFDDKDIQYKIDPDIRMDTFDVYADELRIQQVMNNLISNSLKFTPPGGTVTVNATMVKKEGKEVKIFFSVSDTGIGIEQEKLQSIFESFSQGDTATTRKYGGTGLGLSISKSIIGQMGSTIYLNSVREKGSNFYFMVTLPVYHKQDADNGEQKIIFMDSLKNIRVLIAEDNPINMVVAKRILQKWGIKVEEAVNGKIALEKVEKENYDLLLIDLEMPEMDGKTAVRKINQLKKGIPSLAFTASVYENMKQDLLQAGFTDYILKPFKPEDLYRKIIAALQYNQHPVV
jgi:signal transduction histidine kinase/ActR/RegA family two-component response regulator